jgi:nitrogen regulatory protein P-II 1
MKLITAIVQPAKLDELIGTVIDSKAYGMTVTDVRGFGRQYGHRPGDAAIAPRQLDDPRSALLPKVRLDLVVLDDDVESIVAAIAKHARTDTIGDGKIWVTPVDGAMRVRTGERGRDAL